MEGNFVKVSVKHRLFLASAVVILFALGVLLFALNYSNLFSGNALIFSPNQGKDVQKPADDYKLSASGIISDYLLNDSNSADFSTKTETAKNKLLDLIVPLSFKDSHLELILSLEKIQRFIDSNEPVKIQAELDKIRLLAD